MTTKLYRISFTFKAFKLTGLRSGFVAGDADLLKPYLQYRTYHGAAMPVQHQLASIAAWNDENHVEENRKQYRAKFDLFQSELGHLLPLQNLMRFYYWLKVDNDETFAKMLMEKAHIKVLRVVIYLVIPNKVTLVPIMCVWL